MRNSVDRDHRNRSIVVRGQSGLRVAARAREVDPLDDEELQAARREGRRAFMFIDEEPVPPPHADIWVFGDPVQVRANPRAVPRLKVLTDAPKSPSAFS